MLLSLGRCLVSTEVSHSIYSSLSKRQQSIHIFHYRTDRKGERQRLIMTRNTLSGPVYTRVNIWPAVAAKIHLLKTYCCISCLIAFLKIDFPEDTKQILNMQHSASNQDIFPSSVDIFPKIPKLKFTSDFD